MELIRKYHAKNCEDKEILIDIEKAISSSLELRNKKDLIEDFIKNIDPSKDVDETWENFVKQRKKQELEQIIKEENLKKQETYNFVKQAFRDGEIKEFWTEIVNILPPINLFDKTWTKAKKKKTVLEKLKHFFERFFDISGKEI